MHDILHYHIAAQNDFFAIVRLLQFSKWHKRLKLEKKTAATFIKEKDILLDFDKFYH